MATDPDKIAEMIKGLPIRAAKKVKIAEQIAAISDAAGLDLNELSPLINKELKDLEAEVRKIGRKLQDTEDRLAVLSDKRKKGKQRMRQILDFPDI